MKLQKKKKETRARLKFQVSKKSCCLEQVSSVQVSNEFRIILSLGPSDLKAV